MPRNTDALPESAAAAAWTRYRTPDTRSPDTGVDNWTACLNRIMRDLLMAYGPVSDASLAQLIIEKNRIARQMRELPPTPAEWCEIQIGVKARLRDMVRR
jgi:hypothetical protein